MPRYDYDDDDVIDYEEGDYSDYDYDDNDDVPPEEDEEMQIAVVETQSLLGDRNIDQKDIQQALWDNDFDVKKSAKKLREKYDKENKPKKDQAASSSSNGGSKLAELARSRANGDKPLSKLAMLRKSSEEQSSAKSSKLAELAKSKLQQRDQLDQPGPSSKSSLVAQKTSKLESLAAQKSPELQPEPGQKTSKLAMLAKSRKEPRIELKSPALSKLAASRKSPAPRAPSPTKSTEPEPRKAKKQKTAQFPEIDLEVKFELPSLLVGRPSVAGQMFTTLPANIEASMQSALYGTNTIFSPLDFSKVKQAFQQPSPDDIVQEAQKRAGFIEKGVADLKISEPAPPKAVAPPKSQKKLDVVNEMAKTKQSKPSINFVVIGHVDAGKSTLMGRLLYDAGVVNKKTIEKYKQESEKTGKKSFHLAWVLDQTAEERQRGVTMDFCMSSFETPKASFTIVDAPGHRDFVPNMIAGSAQADFAVLVVDSATNAFESGFDLDGQTKEHAILVRSLGVEHIVVAVNKLDTVNWIQERFDEIRIQLAEFLGKIGYKESQMHFVPTSGLLGDNVTKKSTHKELSWYKSDTLLSVLEKGSQFMKQAKRDATSDLRLIVASIQESEHTKDATITGRIDRGNVQVGEAIVFSPSMTYATVKAIEDGSGSRPWAAAGTNVSLVLQGLDTNNVSDGDVVSSVGSAVQPVYKFVARIVVFDLKVPLLKGSKLILHRGRANEPCKIAKILATLDKSTGQVVKKKPRHLISGQTANVEIQFESRAVPMELFKDNKELGRIILRKEGATVAAGVVDELIFDDPTKPKEERIEIED
ncbi:elongation factor 1 alpha-like protein [Trichomonascus vanleenenianus]|uniref:ribosome dissociation factor GTPase HBS1 n=1 Tax=Trichomonascus vanleenenianus TaxID=2268995 RepID=UPI003ECB7D27